MVGLCFARVHASLSPGTALRGGPAACQTGGWGVLEAPPLTSPTPPTKLWDLSRCPGCWFSAASLSYGVRDQAIRALHVLLFLCVGGRQEDPDQACDGHRRRADGRRHRAGERALSPGCGGVEVQSCPRRCSILHFSRTTAFGPILMCTLLNKRGRLGGEHWCTRAHWS